jgi:hypothetical protein
MAELAIPLVALGSLFVIAQEDKKKKATEKYTNLNKKNIATEYPNPEPVNENNSLNYYPNSNQSTDRYFNETGFDNTVNKETISELEKVVNISSLTGNPVSRNDFKHNNMVPFFGGRIRGAGGNYDQAELRLDNMQGTGTQQISKAERAPLFQPEKNLSYAHGAPDSTAFYLSRQNPSMNYANVKPWETQNVGPGLNQGYTTNGSQGFNAGMEAREKWLPKTVDELRADTNPKLTFGLAGHQGPALAPVTNTGIEGRVEKYHPDTFFANTPNRWLTTTGLEKAERQRAETILREVNDCNTEYFGGGKDVDATYVKGAFEDGFSQQLPALPIGVAGQESGSRNHHDMGRDTENLTVNNRNTTQNQDVGGLGHAVSAIIAPILDVLKPTRKENVIGNLRRNGNVNNNTGGAYVNNPYDRTRVTNRQTLENRMTVNVQAGDNHGYMLANPRAPVGQRPSTNHTTLLTAGGAVNQQGERSVENVLNQRNNCNRLQNSVVLPGNMELFNGNQQLANIRDDCSRKNNRWWVPNGNQSIIPTGEMIGRIQSMQSLDEDTQRQRIKPDILEAFKQNPYTQSLNSATPL